MKQQADDESNAEAVDAADEGEAGADRGDMFAELEAFVRHGGRPPWPHAQAADER